MRIQLPSANFIFRQAANTIRRFPFEAMFALIGTAAAVSLANGTIYGLITDERCTRILMVSAVGLPLSLATSLYVKSKALPLPTTVLLKFLACGIAIALLFVLNPAVYPQDNVHFVLLSVASHLLISFAAFTAAGDTIKFWHLIKPSLAVMQPVYFIPLF